MLKFLGIAWLVLVLDFFSKSWMISHLHPHEPLFITDFFNLNLTFNTGASFGFLHHESGWQWYFFTGLSIFASVFILGWLWKLKPQEKPLAIALNLILGGALGNLTDRFYYGAVVDFLQFHWWNTWSFAIFNVADAAITLGTLLLVWCWWSEEKK